MDQQPILLPGAEHSKPSTRPRHRQLKQADWEPKREIIKQLYPTMELKSLIGHMEEVYQFKAT